MQAHEMIEAKSSLGQNETTLELDSGEIRPKSVKLSPKESNEAIKVDEKAAKTQPVVLKSTFLDIPPQQPEKEKTEDEQTGNVQLDELMGDNNEDDVNIDAHEAKIREMSPQKKQPMVR